VFFDLQVVRFSFRAQDHIYFPPGKAGNVLRGGFGLALRDTAPPETYRRIFEPTREHGPSGLAAPPRPFVFRAAHLDGRRLTPGDTFHFDLHHFDTRHSELDPFTAALDHLGRQGLGPGRGRAIHIAAAAEFIRVQLTPEPVPIHRLHVRFLTPTELKAGETLAPRPEFGILFARARDRVATLAAFYGETPLECDFRALGQRAQAVGMIECRLQHVQIERRSARTGQTHPLGGFTGDAVYEGNLAEFIPWLNAATRTGVGRQTVWGNGAIAVAAIPQA